MSFFSIDLKDIQATGIVPHGTPLQREDYTSHLNIAYDAIQKRYIYSFDEPQYVLWDPNDTLTFKLNNLSTERADMWILKHNCTEPGAIKLIKSLQDHTEIAAPDAYSNRAQAVTMKLQIPRHLLIHIGIIIVIEPKDGSKVVHLLCDPQIGSGPP